MLRRILLLVLLGNLHATAFAAENDARPGPAATATAPDANWLPENVAMRFGDSRWQAGYSIVHIRYAVGDKTLVTIDNSGRIVTWDAERGLPLRNVGNIWLATLTNRKTNEPNFFCDVSADGSIAAVCTAEGQLGVWNLAESKLLFPISERMGRVVGLLISRDGKSIHVQFATHAIRQIGVADGKLIRELPGTGSEVNDSGTEQCRLQLAECADDDKLQSLKTSDDGIVPRAFALKSGDLTTAKIKPGKTARILYSAEGRLAAADDKQGKITIWDVLSGERRCELPAAVVDSKYGARFSPDEKMLAIRQRDRTIVIWDLATSKVRCRLELTESFNTNRASINSAQNLSQEAFAFSSDSRLLAASCRGRSLRIWDIDSGRESDKSSIHAGPVGLVHLTSDGKSLITNSSDNRLRWWDLASGRCVRSWQLPINTSHVVLTPDGRTVVTRDLTGTLHHWQASDGKLQGTWQASKDCIGASTLSDRCQLAITPDGARLLLTQHDAQSALRRITLHDVTNHREMIVFDAGSSIKDRYSIGDQSSNVAFNCPAVFSPDGSLAAAIMPIQEANRAGSTPGAKATRSIKVWDVSTQLVAAELRVPNDHYTALRISPTNRVVALSFLNNDKIFIWEIASGNPRLQLQTGVQAQLFDFLPNGKSLAVLGLNTCVIVDASGQSVRPTLKVVAHRSHILDLAVGPDNQTVATGSVDQTAVTYSIPKIKSPQDDAPELTPQQRTDLWEHVTGQDAEKAYRAMSRLSRSPTAAFALIRQNVLEQMQQRAARFAKLIQQLGAEQYDERERATKALKAAGSQARAELLAASQTQADPEIRSRVNDLLKLLTKQSFDVQRVELSRSIETLELIASVESRQLVAELAAITTDPTVRAEINAALARMGK